jgi:hypothetical protein
LDCVFHSLNISGNDDSSSFLTIGQFYLWSIGGAGWLHGEQFFTLSIVTELGGLFVKG